LIVEGGKGRLRARRDLPRGWIFEPSGGIALPHNISIMRVIIIVYKSFCIYLKKYRYIRIANENYAAGN
jgi:hypothetical protein